ncbi:hypothetical protein [Streptomyces malaysiensis]|uniref:hypothetical protein n=1 Tax=Streptomyces malaysiensis TaxID=92644 RepID=UPI00142EB4CB|nr:hypothetical protein [Streptomyces malaysiensis]
MAQIPFTGTLRTREINEVRKLREFSIGVRGQRVGLSAVYADEESGIAWIECNTGRWRLPPALLEWALTVEARAVSVLGHADVFPCRAVFSEMPDGSLDVEIFPEGCTPRQPLGR